MTSTNRCAPLFNKNTGCEVYNRLNNISVPINYDNI